MDKDISGDSDSDAAPRVSDENVFRDEEIAESLLGGNSRSGVRSLLSRGDHDPNQPRQPTRKEIRQQKRSDRKARRKSKKKGNGTQLLYKIEEGADSGDSFSSLDDAKAIASLRRTKKRKHCRIVLALLVVAGILAAFVFGAARVSHPRHIDKNKKRTLRSNGTSLFAPTTILVSLDGFRADFLDRGLTPVLSGFVEEGVSPKHMLPSFPSVTFPNHWTLATGLYPEAHGVVGNTFYDKEINEQFDYKEPSHSLQAKWWTSTGAQPIWSTAEDQGVITAVHMWPGSEAGVEPGAAYLDRYNGHEKLESKVSRVLGLLDMPSPFDEDFDGSELGRPAFIAAYVPHVDTDGHKYGPNSTHIRETISKVDTMLGDLFAGLEERNLTQIVNVVVVSDHGMATTSKERLIQLEDLIDVNEIEHIDGWPLYGLRPRSTASIDALYQQLKQASAKNEHFEVYLRKEMPERWHFSNNERIAPLWIIPETGWAIVTKSDFDVEASRDTDAIFRPLGLHGYDHEHPLMRAIFIARGPAFPHTPNSEIPVFQNTEVYNIVCDSLEIDPKPNNGTLRLPLKTVGLHSDEDVKTTTIGSTAPTKSGASPSETSKVGDGKKIETHKGSFWDNIIDKIKETWYKLKEKLHNGSRHKASGS